MNITDHEWMEQFENATLPSSGFHHVDHVKMAFLYLQLYPPLEAIKRFSSALIRFARANGKPNLYHETITWAFLLLIRERMVRAGSPLTWAEFAAANPDLIGWRTTF